MIQFVVFGHAVAQGRPRACIRGNRAAVYDPTKSRSYKEYVKLVASQHAPSEPLTGALVVEVKVYRAIPKSFSGIKGRRAERGEIRPTSKPDVDSYAKSVKDALSGVIWRDDSQVVDLVIGKWYSVTPRVEITIRSVD